jgi:integrase
MQRIYRTRTIQAEILFRRLFPSIPAKAILRKKRGPETQTATEKAPVVGNKDKTEEVMALFRYPNSKNWWYEFQFSGQRIRESTKTKSKKLATEAERSRRREIEEVYNGVKRRDKAKLFSVAAEEWLELKKLTLASSSVRIEQANLKHLLPQFGRLLVTDIHASDISKYQQTRLGKEASPKTVNLEVGTLRAILRRNRTWANIQLDVRMLATRDDIGHALTDTEEEQILRQCQASRSRALYPAVLLALSTAMRYGEIRLLTWRQIDLTAATVTVGKSKTVNGSGRVIPLNSRALTSLQAVSRRFPDRLPSHFVFPTEKYGAAGNDFSACVYETDPTRPIGDWKEAWEAAKRRANVTCRFHDLRHTACTRMLEGGIPYPVVASIMGWSAATAIRMAKRYGHIGHKAHQQAASLLNGSSSRSLNIVPISVSESFVQ